MELRKGYMQTEIGVIPNDWDVLVLKHVLNVIADVDHYMPQTTKIGIPYVMTGDLKELVSEIDFDNCKQISTRDYKLLSKKIKNSKGDVILARYATIGTVSYVDINFDFIVSYSCVTIKPNPSKLSGLFLFNYFKSRTFKIEVNNVINANTQANVGIGDLNTMKIALPSLSEQTAIATALSDADGLITGLEKLIAKKRNIKQGAMQQLLQPKEGWEVKKLGDVIINFQNGYGFSAIGYVKSGIPIITMAQIGLDGSFNFDESKVNFWKPEDFSMLKNFHIKNGDLIIAMTDITPEKNLIGRMAIVKTNRTLLLNQRVGLLRLDDTKVNAYFLKTLSNMRVWRTYCIGSASLGVQANIGTKDILNGELSLPNINEQNKIAEILYDMDTEINALKQKLEKYKKVKLGMMQELLTGKTRLN
jgi:type I restriction enzyme S subunit